MHVTHQQEEFSRAYIYAVAAAAGMKFSPAAAPDDDSVDVMISFPLKAKNYEDLRHTDYQTPRILVVVFVPEQVRDWTAHTEQALVLRYCAYWWSLGGLPASSNQRSTTVHLPRTNLFNVAGLEALMDRIGGGASP